MKVLLLAVVVVVLENDPAHLAAQHGDRSRLAASPAEVVGFCHLAEARDLHHLSDPRLCNE